MRSANPSRILGVSLLALATLNFTVLDQLGVALVSDVHEKYESLGADWIALSRVASPGREAAFDPQELAEELEGVQGVQETLAYWQVFDTDSDGGGTRTSSTYTFNGTGPNPTVVTTIRATYTNIVLLGPTFDFANHPYVYTLARDEAENISFTRNEWLLREGRAPARAGEIAIESGHALEHDLRLGSRINLTLGDEYHVTPAPPTHNVSFVVTGIYDRLRAGHAGESVAMLVAAYDPALHGYLGDARNVGGASAVVLARAHLPEATETAARIVHHLTQRNLTVDAAHFPRAPGGAVAWRSVEVEGSDASATTSTTPPPTSTDGTEEPGGDYFVTMGGPGDLPDAVLFANGDVLEHALRAAANAGWWFRALTVGALALAVIGIAFVTAALDKQMRRRYAVRQALGYGAASLWGLWGREALIAGGVGALAGAAAAWLLATTGAAETLLNVPLRLDWSRALPVAILVSILAYGVATFRRTAAILRQDAVQNLRILQE